MYAHCYRSGEIEVSRKDDLPGMIMFFEAPAKELRRKLNARARHAYDGKTLLVPGIPEAENGDDALDALDAFKRFMAK